MTDTPKTAEELSDEFWNDGRAPWLATNMIEVSRSELVALVESAMAAGKAAGIREAAESFHAEQPDVAGVFNWLSDFAETYDTGIEKPHG